MNYNFNWYKKAQTTQQYRYKTSQEIYRGDPDPLSVEDYDPSYGVEELGKDLGASGAWGPGMYFADKLDVAQMYGANITRRKLHNANILTKQSPLFNRNQIVKVLEGVNEEIMVIAISNWDEDYNRGKKILINEVLNADNPLEQLMNIWSEIFLHQNRQTFINLMINNGIDGISLQKEDVTYYVIYNKNILK